MKNVKDELKETRNQKDMYKSKYEEALNFQQGEKNNETLKSSIGKLVSEVQMKYYLS